MHIQEVEAPMLHRMLAENPDGVNVIDVREPQEVAQGTVPGASHIPLRVVPLKLQDITKDKPVVFFCRSGARSAQATMYLAQQGFDNVFNLRGGAMAWAQHGLDFGLPQTA